jgi:hypothetical protein
LSHDKKRKERVAEQLGMQHSTAAHQLRRNILFKYVVEAGDNFCFKCGAEIESSNDYSIEHKQPWENRDPELFWDLNNIAFSHKWCNIKHSPANGAEKLRIVGPDDTVWCNRCKQFLPSNQFHRNAARWSGYQRSCKECHKVHKGRVKA